MSGDLKLDASLMAWLALAVLLLLCLASAVDSAVRKKRLARLGDPRLVARLTASLHPTKRRVRNVLFIVGMSLAVLSLSRPSLPKKSTPPPARGIDLVIALDVSTSMMATDVKPNRLDAAKSELASLLDRMTGERVALVAFAGDAIRYPLTTDRDAVKLFWSELTPGDMPVKGTALAEAIESSVRTLVSGREIGRERDQVILLVTDGEETAGGKPLNAAQNAKELGIRIYTVGIGTDGTDGNGVVVPEIDADGRTIGEKHLPDGTVVRSKLDRATLQEISKLTGGEYFSMAGGLAQIAGKFAALKRAVTKEQKFANERKEEAYAWLLYPAFLMLVAEAILSERRSKRGRA